MNSKKKIRNREIEKIMGVRGLKSFLERENQIREINIGNEIRKWKG